MQKRYLFCSFDRNVSKPQKKGPFSRFWRDRFKLKKRYLLRALKFCLVKWEMDEKRTILTLKLFSPESLKYPPFFSKKVPFFIFSPDRLALTKKVTILHKCRKLIFLLFSSSRVDLFVKNQNCRNLSLILPPQKPLDTTHRQRRHA